MSCWRSYNTAMERRRLGNTSLEISRIGLGCWAMGGGDWLFGWGHQDDADSVATIRRAVELGINWVDTAPVYGLGHSEAVVGSALKSLPASERPLVFTKCSRVWTRSGRIRHALESRSIERELEDSLRRLGIDTIDLYQIHWPAYPADGPAPGIEEGWETLSRLKDSGKVREIGVSNFNVEQLERIRPIAAIGSLQPAYSLVRRDIEKDVLPYCAEHGIGVIVYSPMASGLLSGKMTRERVASFPGNDWRKTKSLEFQEPALTRNLACADRVRAVAEPLGHSTAELAIAWTLNHPAVSAAIVGARRPAQLDDVVGAVAVAADSVALAGLDEPRVVEHRDQN